MERFIGLLGLLVFLFIPWLLSTNRRAVSKRLVLWGVGLQTFFAFIILPDSIVNLWIKDWFGLEEAPGAVFFSAINSGIVRILDFTKEGMAFLARSFSLARVDPSFENFIFDVLPTILFFSGLMAVLYHLGLIQVVVRRIARLMRKTMGTSGSESLSASANIFVGQTEAPLVIKPYVAGMTRSELMAIMTGGMATVSGGVMAAYVAFLKDYFPDIAGHLMAASIMSAPAALVIAKILVPETEQSETAGEVKMEIPKTSSNVIDAAASGAAEGLKLAANVAAMLLVFIALIALFDSLIGVVGGWMGAPDLTFSRITGWIFSPLAFLIGIPFEDTFKMAEILGQKTIINEFVAFKSLADILNDPASQVSERSIMLITYALCGFSNFSSIAIQIGGIGTIAPARRHELAQLGLRALLAGTFACLMTASLAGLISVGDKARSTLTAGIATEDNGSKTKTPIQDTFETLRNKLAGQETLQRRQSYWRDSARGHLVQWDGRLYEAGPDQLLFYYGVKNIYNTHGGERDYSYLRLDLNGSAPEFRVWRTLYTIQLPADSPLAGLSAKEAGDWLSGRHLYPAADQPLPEKITLGEKLTLFGNTSALADLSSGEAPEIMDRRKKEYKLSVDQLKKGDLLKDFRGILREYQINDRVLFRLESHP